MIPAIITVVVVFAFYLLMTFSALVNYPDGILFWSREELVAGLILSVIAGIVAQKIFVMKRNYRMLNPLRWLLFFVYAIGPFFIAMAKANLDVAYRVLTGKIRPGIVKISTNLKTDFGITLLANSITLTPGTLSVDIDEKTNDLYIHWINVAPDIPKKREATAEEICGSFPKWARRIAE